MGLFGMLGRPNIEKMKARQDIPGLTKALGYQKDWKVRWRAAEALGQIGDAGAVEPLITALEDSAWNVRGVVVLALGQIGDVRSVGPLIEALNDEYAGVRMNAAGVLGTFGDPSVFKPLITALKDEYAEVRMNAAISLGEIGDRRAVKPLIAALKEPFTGKRIKSMKDDDLDVRVAVASALLMIGGQHTIELLIAALQDTNSLLCVRGVAAHALGEIGDPEAIEPLTIALAREIAVFAVMPYEKARGATGFDAHGKDLSKIKEPALIFVAELALQWLKKDPDIWKRVINQHETKASLNFYTDINQEWPNEIKNLKPGELKVMVVAEYIDAVRAVNELESFRKQAKDALKKIRAKKSMER
jgi:hypothetical protein